MDTGVSEDSAVTGFRRQLETLAVEFERAHSEALDLAEENSKLRAVLEGLEPGSQVWTESQNEKVFRQNKKKEGVDFEDLELKSHPISNGFDPGPRKSAKNGFASVDDEILDEHTYHCSTSWQHVLPDLLHTKLPSVNSLDPASLMVEVSSMSEKSEDEVVTPPPSGRGSQASADSLLNGRGGGSIEVASVGSTGVASLRGGDSVQSLEMRKSVTIMIGGNERETYEVQDDAEITSEKENASTSLLERVSAMRAFFSRKNMRKSFNSTRLMWVRLFQCDFECDIAPSSNSIENWLLAWGVCAFLCILLELWLIPVELVFFEKKGMPHAMDQMLHGLAVFFAVDILVNLSAGCMGGDETPLQLLFFPQSYIWLWFCVDVSATAPAWILMITDVTAGNLSDDATARDVLTGLRLLHVLRLARMAHQAKSIMDEEFVLNMKWTSLVVLQAVLVLVVFAHIHGCVWAALQPEWVAVGTVSEAFRHYFQSFWWAFTAFAAGAIGYRQARVLDEPRFWALEIVVATERLLFIIFLTIQVLGSREHLPSLSSVVSPKALTIDPTASDIPPQILSQNKPRRSSRRGGRRDSLASTDSMAILNIDSDSEEELLKAPEAFPTFRRVGVSAEACGAFNQRYQDKKGSQATASLQSPEDRVMLIAGLRKLPFLYNVQQFGIEKIVDTMELEYIPQGEWVYHKGDVGRSVYITVSGTAALSSENPADGSEATRFLHPKDLFGETTMLWGFRREHSVQAHTDLVVGKLKRDNFFHLVTQHEWVKNTQKQSILRKVRLFDMLNDEMICKLCDVLERRSYPAGSRILSQGDDATSELFIVWDGMCVSTTSRQSCVPRETRRLKKGEYFGETGFLREGVSHHSVNALGKVKVLVLTARKFTRLFGDFHHLAEDLMKRDPRTAIADFYRPGDNLGPRGLKTRHTYANLDKGLASEWFAIFRPTSRDAIAKMIDGSAVGKGLNIKGKSSKMNNLSGFVPFIQISNNEHKDSVEESPESARTMIYYQSKWARSLALQVLEPLLESSAGLQMSIRDIMTDDSYEGIFGINVPEIVVREAYIMKPDIRYPQGWDSGRPSEPAYMNMNLHSARSSSEPKVVLYQFDQLDPMNPHGLLIAYAEATVKPVVSDFDLFTVGCKGVSFEIPLEKSQSDIAIWMLQNAREVLREPKDPNKTWSSRWLEVMRTWHEKGFHPEPPRFGFGDRLSNSLVTAIVSNLINCGAVRHGAECFNLYFPQELDSEYLIVWEGFESRWEYFQEADMREFLKDRAGEGFSFPLNPVWPIRDAGWYDIYKALKNSSNRAVAFDCWYPPGSGIVEIIESIHQEQENAKQQSVEVVREIQHTRTQKKLHTQRRLASVFQKG